MKSMLNLRWIVAATVFPLLLAGLFVLAVQIQSIWRYDWAYFSETYVERYNTPGSVARELERALQTDDRKLLAELQGLQRPAAFKTSPKLIFVMMWERGDRYISYLYFDMDTYERQMHYVEKVRGRWVVTPPDAYYYLHSGRWIGVFLPIALVWWVVEVVVILGVLVYRLSARLRAQMY